MWIVKNLCIDKFFEADGTLYQKVFIVTMVDHATETKWRVSCWCKWDFTFMFAKAGQKKWHDCVERNEVDDMTTSLSISRMNAHMDI